MWGVCKDSYIYYHTSSIGTCICICLFVTSGLDPCGTRNMDKDGGLSGPRMHGLKLVRQSETWMSKQTPERTSEWSWMARVRIVMRTRTEVRTGSEGAGSYL
jgi:hypothetical protein